MLNDISSFDLFLLTLHHVVLCCAVLCCAVLCCAVLCYAVLYHVICRMSTMLSSSLGHLIPPKRKAKFYITLKYISYSML